MIIKDAEKQQIKKICDTLAPKLISDPFFMYLCPEKAVRRDYINAYFNYYVYEWSRCDTLLADKFNNALITLVDPKTFDYKFKGQGAFKMKQFKLASNVFIHRENMEGIVDIIVPESRDSRAMTIYGNLGTDLEAVVSLIDEAIETANADNLVLVYDTFSRRLLPIMQEKGFRIVYQKNFLNTQYQETVMVYNL